LHGVAGDAVPFAEAKGRALFPSEEVCKAAGDIIYQAFAPSLDAALQKDGVGVLQGARVECKRIDEADSVPA
jgi:hypothetical protein